MQARHVNQVGFTMLEMVMVMVIISIIATIAMPRYISSMDRYRADAAAGRIVAELHEVHSRARAVGQSRTVNFDTAGNRLRVLNNAASSLERAVDLSIEPYRAKIIAAVFGNDTSVIFNGYGRPDTGGKIMVQSGSASRTVILDSQTGQAQVQQ